MLDSTEESAVFSLALLNEVPHLIDRVNAVQVALTLCPAPSEQPMASKDQAVACRIVFHRTFDQQRQFEPWPLPGYPYDLALVFLIEFLQLAFPVRTGRQRNRPVRVQMIHVQKWQEG